MAGGSDVYTVMATAWLHVPPVGRFVGAVIVVLFPDESVRMTLSAEGPPQLIRTAVSVYGPVARIACGMTTVLTGLFHPDLR